MAGGLANDSPIQSFTTSDALDDAGYVMQVEQNGGEGTIVKGAPSGTLIGVAYTSTKDPITDTAAADVKVPVLYARPGLRVYLQVVSDNQEIALLDPLCITSDGAQKGKVDFKDGVNEDNTQIALALEAKAQNAGGTILAVLTAGVGESL